MNQDRNVKVAWGTVNVPSIITTLGAAVGIIVVVLSAVSTFSAGLERVDARLDQLEKRVDAIDASRQTSRDEYNKKIDAVSVRVDTNLGDIRDITASIKQLDYRVTINEQGLTAANARMDRFSDALGDIRDSLSKLNTSIELLTQKLQSAFPSDTK